MDNIIGKVTWLKPTDAMIDMLKKLQWEIENSTGIPLEYLRGCKIKNIAVTEESKRDINKTLRIIFNE